VSYINSKNRNIKIFKTIILPVILYRLKSETCFVALRAELRFSVRKHAEKNVYSWEIRINRRMNKIIFRPAF
jgi:hypothetical protein